MTRLTPESTGNQARERNDESMHAAIDFGISNTDVVAQMDGEIHHWMEPFSGQPDVEMVRTLLAAGGVELADVTHLAVTGGHHRRLPSRIDACQIVGVNEVEAIGRGGVIMADLPDSTQPLLVVSGGSGVAMIAARGNSFTHVTGSGVGGGTLLGLSRLLLGTVDPVEINVLAAQGNPNKIDLALRDVVSGPIGNLPADATAVNFGRLAWGADDTTHAGFTAPPFVNPDLAEADLAAAIVTLIGQVIGTIAVNAARAQAIEQVVMIGHLTDMSMIRTELTHVGRFFGLPIATPLHTGRATALGALYSLPSA